MLALSLEHAIRTFVNNPHSLFPTVGASAEVLAEFSRPEVHPPPPHIITVCLLTRSTHEVHPKQIKF